MSKILKEGWIIKQGGRIKTWKKRWLVLFPGSAIYYTDKGKKLKGSFTITSNSVIALNTSVKYQPAFQISWPNQKRAYVIHVETQDELNAWMDKFKEVANIKRAPAEVYIPTSEEVVIRKSRDVPNADNSSSRTNTTRRAPTRRLPTRVAQSNNAKLLKRDTPKPTNVPPPRDIPLANKDDDKEPPLVELNVNNVNQLEAVLAGKSSDRNKSGKPAAGGKLQVSQSQDQIKVTSADQTPPSRLHSQSPPPPTSTATPSSPIASANENETNPAATEAKSTEKGAIAGKANVANDEGTKIEGTANTNLQNPTGEKAGNESQEFSAKADKVSIAISPENPSNISKPTNISEQAANAESGNKNEQKSSLQQDNSESGKSNNSQDNIKSPNNQQTPEGNANQKKGVSIVVPMPVSAAEDQIKMKTVQKVLNYREELSDEDSDKIEYNGDKFKLPPSSNELYKSPDHETEEKIYNDISAMDPEQFASFHPPDNTKSEQKPVGNNISLQNPVYVPTKFEVSEDDDSNTHGDNDSSNHNAQMKMTAQSQSDKPLPPSRPPPPSQGLLKNSNPMPINQSAGGKPPLPPGATASSPTSSKPAKDDDFETFSTPFGTALRRRSDASSESLVPKTDVHEIPGQPPESVKQSELDAFKAPVKLIDEEQPSPEPYKPQPFVPGQTFPPLDPNSPPPAFPQASPNQPPPMFLPADPNQPPPSFAPPGFAPLNPNQGPPAFAPPGFPAAQNAQPPVFALPNFDLPPKQNPPSPAKTNQPPPANPSSSPPSKTNAAQPPSPTAAAAPAGPPPGVDLSAPAPPPLPKKSKKDSSSSSSDSSDSDDEDDASEHRPRRHIITNNEASEEPKNLVNLPEPVEEEVVIPAKPQTEQKEEKEEVTHSGESRSNASSQQDSSKSTASTGGAAGVSAADLKNLNLKKVEKQEKKKEEEKPGFVKPQLRKVQKEEPQPKEEEKPAFMRAKLRKVEKDELSPKQKEEEPAFARPQLRKVPKDKEEEPKTDETEKIPEKEIQKEESKPANKEKEPEKPEAKQAEPVKEEKPKEIEQNTEKQDNDEFEYVQTPFGLQKRRKNKAQPQKKEEPKQQETKKEQPQDNDEFEYVQTPFGLQKRRKNKQNNEPAKDQPKEEKPQDTGNVFGVKLRKSVDPLYKP